MYVKYYLLLLRIKIQNNNKSPYLPEFQLEYFSQKYFLEILLSRNIFSVTHHFQKSADHSQLVFALLKIIIVLLAQLFFNLDQLPDQVHHMNTQTQVRGWHSLS